MLDVDTLYGTIHKRRRQFFQIFDTPTTISAVFLVQFIVNFDQFMTPSPPNCRRGLWTAPMQTLTQS